MTEKNVTIYTDGGSRGNPGPAAIGGVIIPPDQTKITFHRYIGSRRTNNEAEYEALIYALQEAKKRLGKQVAKNSVIHCFLDSELVVKQLNHQYKLKDEKIQKYFIKIWNLTFDFQKVNFQHIPREKNKEADSLVNKALDAESSKLF